jgi:hypothetical protein
VQYRHDGRQRRQKIKATDVDKARQIATKMLNKVADGTDPAAEKELKRAALTFSKAVAQYLTLKRLGVRAGHQGDPQRRVQRDQQDHRGVWCTQRQPRPRPSERLLYVVHGERTLRIKSGAEQRDSEDSCKPRPRVVRF